MKWKIITDTGSNLREIDNLPENILFDSVPMILHLDDEEVLDTPDINITELMDKVENAEKTGSACPAPGVYAEKFKGADNVICFTISSNVSGSYNSAKSGKQIALEENPDTNIHIFDTKSAGGEIDLLIFKTIEVIKEGYSFEEIIEKVKAYHQTTQAGYMLKSIENLVKNGRVNKIIGSLAGLLNINI